MYIEKYWGDFIGGTDDSLTLTAYLAEKKKQEISLAEIFSDFGRDTLFGDFRNTNPPLCFTDGEGWDMDLHCAIDLVSDLAALLLECKINGSVDLLEADNTLDLDPADSSIQITAAPEEMEQINKILSDFISAPLEYDIRQVDTEESVLELASICEELQKELFVQSAT